MISVASSQLVRR